MGRAFSAGFLFVACLFAAAPGRAQVPAPPPAAPPATQPVTGFVSSYEITRIARSAGFDPLAPPLREGTIYVLRATDYRGILMRVVIDAHTGAIRDANRIVPGPGRYGQFYGVPSLYDPADLAEPVMVPSTADMEAAAGAAYRDALCATGHSAAAATASGSVGVAQAARRRQSGREGSSDRRSEKRGDAGRCARRQAADQFRGDHCAAAGAAGRTGRAEKISRHS